MVLGVQSPATTGNRPYVLVETTVTVMVIVPGDIHSIPFIMYQQPKNYTTVTSYYSDPLCKICKIRNVIMKDS